MLTSEKEKFAPSTSEASLSTVVPSGTSTTEKSTDMEEQEELRNSEGSDNDDNDDLLFEGWFGL